ncbi:MAG: hypothetical protein ACRCY8_15100 [Dermatophilaceae bacterium]
MSIYACLVSRSLGVTLFLGKPLRQPGGAVTGFWRGDGVGPAFVQSLWRLVEDADDLVMASEGMTAYEAAYDLPSLGDGDESDDLPYETFLAAWRPVTARYVEVRRLGAVSPDGRGGAPPPLLERRQDHPGAPLERFVDGRWRAVDPGGHAISTVEIGESAAAASVLLALHDADPALVRHHARRSARARDSSRFRYWATFDGGNPTRPVTVDYDIPGHGRGWYTRHRGDRASSLLRFDRDALSGRAGAVLCWDGRWRWSESPERNVWRGSDYGEPVSARQARRIAAEFGHPADVVVAEAIIRTP